MLKIIIIVGVALAIPVFFFVTWFVSTHNRLLVLRTRLRTAFAQIHAHIKHRSDLVPDLIELAKPAFKEEMAVLQQLASARLPAASAIAQTNPEEMTRSGVKQLSTSDRALSDGLDKFFGATEQKPELNSQRLFVNLKEDLMATAKAIATAREIYNQAATGYNAISRRFPAMIIARLFGFDAAEPF
jgi:LemA protein